MSIAGRASRPGLADLPARFDVIVVGGGINGAGILRELARHRVTVLLLEKRDYAARTSSASSKLIHGGLRYLKTGQWRLTLESVRERRRLLDEAPRLVETQEFLMPVYRGVAPGKWTMRLGLWLYDLMAGQRSSRWMDARTALALEPSLRAENLLGAVQYRDAQTDDARLVLRLLFEAARVGEGRVHLRNYTGVAGLLEAGGRVTGVKAVDAESGATRELQAGLVIRATGAETVQAAGAPRLRPLRGSHLVFPHDRLPLGRAVSWLHPADRRPIFAYPWLGATLFGTTDLDHEPDDARPPRMSRAEADYLLEGLAHQFPGLPLGAGDALSSYAGVRPVVAGGKQDPSAESRESALWSRPGEVGIAGGKLTTFRVTSREVLREAARQLPALAPAPEQALFDSGTAPQYAELPEGEQTVGGVYRLADLRRSVRQEHVVHLDDLLLRRTRLGLLEPRGGEALLPRVRGICLDGLGWDEARWAAECRRYLDIWVRDHSVLDPGGAP